MKRINHKSSAVLSIVLILTICLLISSMGCEKKEENVIKIGAILPLTGSAADIGNWQKDGIDLSAEQINKHGGINGKRVVVIYEDSQSDPKTGVNAFEKIMATEKNCEVLFCSLTSVSSAIIPLINKRERVLMMLAVSLPGITERSKWAFRYNLGSDDEAEAMAAYLGSKGVKKVSVAYINDEFGLGALKTFESSYSKVGGKVVTSVSYEADWTDFRTILAKLKDVSSEYIYVIGYVKASVLLIRQMREMGINLPIAANMALSVPSYMKIGGEALEGAIFSVTRFDPDSKDPRVKDFVDLYFNTYGEKPTFFAAFAFDALNLVADAMIREGTTAKKIRIGLLKTVDYNGVMGHVQVKENGNMKFPTRIVRIENGHIVSVTK